VGLYERTDSIRRLINVPWKQSALYRMRRSWLQACSALDVIGDTELAVEAYLQEGLGEHDGSRYLAVYGLLQALYTQQDAVSHLCKALKIKSATISPDWHEYPAIRSIRNVRNTAIGHPTEVGRREPFSYHFISRVTLTHHGFDLQSSYSDGREVWQTVSLHDLIGKQADHLGRILDTVIDELTVEAAAHRARFRGEEMVNVFPPGLPYGFQNLFQATYQEPNLARVAIAKGAVEQINEVLSAFAEAASRRGLAEALHLDWTYEAHALSVLDEYFDHLLAGQEPNIDYRTARIFVSFLERQIDHLRETASEIDEDFST